METFIWFGDTTVFPLDPLKPLVNWRSWQKGWSIRFPINWEVVSSEETSSTHELTIIESGFGAGPETKIIVRRPGRHFARRQLQTPTHQVRGQGHRPHSGRYRAPNAASGFHRRPDRRPTGTQPPARPDLRLNPQCSLAGRYPGKGFRGSKRAGLRTNLPGPRFKAIPKDFFLARKAALSANGQSVGLPKSS